MNKLNDGSFKPGSLYQYSPIKSGLPIYGVYDEHHKCMIYLKSISDIIGRAQPELGGFRRRRGIYRVFISYRNGVSQKIEFFNQYDACFILLNDNMVP